MPRSSGLGLMAIAVQHLLVWCHWQALSVAGLIPFQRASARTLASKLAKLSPEAAKPGAEKLQARWPKGRRRHGALCRWPAPEQSIQRVALAFGASVARKCYGRRVRSASHGADHAYGNL